MPKDCPFCQLAMGNPTEHKTEWFYLYHRGIVVEDLNPKGHTMRLLYVPREHVHCGEQHPFAEDCAQMELMAVARAICQNRGLTIVKWDMGDHSYSEHWHAQVCLDKKEG